MQVVQSFWTKPVYTQGEDRSKGGFWSMRYNLQSWALSRTLLDQVYGDVLLVTDRRGKALLADELALPYSHVAACLDELNGYPQELWALGKMKAYSLQEEAFLHLDHDAFLWQRLPERVESAAVFTQSPEKLIPDAREVFELVIERFDYFPAPFLVRRHAPDLLDCFNAGVIGGQDHALYREYAAEAFRFVAQNDFARIPRERWPTINMFFEQLMLQCYCREREVPVAFLFEGEYPYSLLEHSRHLKMKQEPGYVHLMQYKTSQEMAGWVDRWLRLANPELYYRVEWYCKKQPV